MPQYPLNTLNTYKHMTTVAQKKYSFKLIITDEVGVDVTRIQADDYVLFLEKQGGMERLLFNRNFI